MPQFKKTPTGPFHSGYGCLIFIIMALTFGAIIGWAAYTLLKQNNEIASFTTEEAKPLPAIVLSDTDKTALADKLKAFAQTTAAKQTAALALSIADLNALLVLAQDNAIGNQEGSAPYMEMLRITGLDAKEKLIRTDIRLPINKLPLIGKGTRYLIGTATFKPEIMGGSFDIKVQNITVPSKTVSEGFLYQLRDLPWLSVAKLKPDIAAALGKVTSFEISADERTLVLRSAAAGS